MSSRMSVELFRNSVHKLQRKQDKWKKEREREIASSRLHRNTNKPVHVPQQQLFIKFTGALDIQRVDRVLSISYMCHTYRSTITQLVLLVLRALWVCCSWHEFRLDWTNLGEYKAFSESFSVLVQVQFSTSSGSLIEMEKKCGFYSI